MKRIYYYLAALLLPCACWLLATTYAIAPWLAWGRLLVTAVAASLVVAGGWLSLRSPTDANPLPAVLLIAGGAAGLAIAGGQPQGVAGGLLLSASATLLLLTLASSKVQQPDQARPQATIYLQAVIGSLPGVWLTGRAALGAGEWLSAALLLVAPLLLALAVLRSGRVLGWVGRLLAAVGLGLTLVSPWLVQALLRPFVSSLEGLPAWANLDLRPISSAEGQGGWPSGLGLLPPAGQIAGPGEGYLAVLGLAVSFVALLAVAWLLHRLLRVMGVGRQQ